MKQPKQHLYALLTNESTITDLVQDRIHFQADDVRQNNYKNTFPMITLYRIGGSSPSKTIKRIDRFQITTWDHTNLGADALADHVIQLLHHRKDEVMKKCYLLGGRVDLYDQEVKVHGIAMTFDMIMSEDDY